MIELGMFKKLMHEYGERIPLLTLDEFFNDNMDEYSIAPNQWSYGRVPLAEIEEILNKMESMPDGAWVRIVLHDDTEIEECNGKRHYISTEIQSYFARPFNLQKWKIW